MQVCISSLHISLRVFFKLFTLFEEAAHELDILIATTLDWVPHGDQQLAGLFSEYVEVLRTISRLTEEAYELMDHDNFLYELANWNTLKICTHFGKKASPKTLCSGKKRIGEITTTLQLVTFHFDFIHRGL